MRFLSIIKGPELTGPPPQELMDAIAELGIEETKSGTLINTGGLGPTATRTRVRVANGDVTVTDGPFTEAKEVIGGYAILEYNSKEEAVEGVVRFIELHKKYWPDWQGEAEVGQIFGPEDGPHW